MSDLKLCFNADSYNEAIDLMLEDGYSVSGQKIQLKGKYLCESGREDVIIERDAYVGEFTPNLRLWTDEDGRFHRIININALPSGVKASIFAYIGLDQNSDLMYQIRKYYLCVDESWFSSDGCGKSDEEKLESELSSRGCKYIRTIDKGCAGGFIGRRVLREDNCNGKIEIRTIIDTCKPYEEHGPHGMSK